MKKIHIIIAALAIAACTGNNSNTYQQEAEKLSELLENYMANYDDSSDIKAEYNKEDGCICLSWKSETLTASYDIHFKDILSDNPTSYAEGFRISMIVRREGATQITKLEFVYEGIPFKMIPYSSDAIGDGGLVMAAFLQSDKSTKDCFKMLSNLSGVVTGKIYTDNGTIDMPLNDVFNLRGMARSYVINGGTFE